MSSTTAAVEKVRRTRSRAGCRECRRLHRKCNEGRPSCQQCQQSKVDCTYAKDISWGGRSFLKSRFGKCVTQGAVTIHVQVQNMDTDLNKVHFVYSAATASAQKTLNSVENAEGTRPSTHASCIVTATSSPARSTPGVSGPSPTWPLLVPSSSVSQNPDWLPWLPREYHVLLNHFASTVTRCFSLHKNTHNNFGSTYIPMALERKQVPGNYLLATILSLAALHRKSLGLKQNETELIRLRHASIELFRSHMDEQAGSMDDTALATALMLCLCEIISGGERPDSWRLHLTGAAAILQKPFGDGERTMVSPIETPTRIFLRRWWRSLEVLAMLSGIPSLSVGSRFALHIARSCDYDYIDEFDGFTTSLIPIFATINLLSLEQEGHQSKYTTREANLQHILEKGNQAIHEVNMMIANPISRFHPSLEPSLSAAQRSDFMLLNQMYHHVALLQLYNRILRLPSISDPVQLSVHKIILCLGNIGLEDEACPGVALLQPIFSAGCEASGPDDRSTILNWMDKMESHYGMGNVKHARAFLKQFWQAREEQQDQDPDIRWHEFLIKKGWELSLY